MQIFKLLLLKHLCPVVSSLIYFLPLSGKNNVSFESLQLRKGVNVPAAVPELRNEVWVSVVTTGFTVFCQLCEIVFNLSGLFCLLFFLSVQLLTVFLNVGIATFTPPLLSLNKCFWVT